MQCSETSALLLAAVLRVMNIGEAATSLAMVLMNVAVLPTEDKMVVSKSRPLDLQRSSVVRPEKWSSHYLRGKSGGNKLTVIIDTLSPARLRARESS